MMGEWVLVAWVVWTVLVALAVKYSWVNWWRQFEAGYNE